MLCASSGLISRGVFRAMSRGLPRNLSILG
jgi:hypothetical protein